MLKLEATQAVSNPVLVGAVLLYGQKGIRYHQHDGDAISVATVHDVVQMPSGRPEIAPGRLMTRQDLQGIQEGLAGASKTHGAEWIEDHVLAAGSDRVVWWTPKMQRTLFFAESSFNGKGTFNGSCVAEVPSMVWCACSGSDSLYVYAIKGNDRPSKATPLQRAPFFNVWEDGRVCIGNAEAPKGDGWSDTRAWESMFFGSRFTHPNLDAKRILKTDLIKFWKAKTLPGASPEPFPESKLVPIGVKIESLLAKDLRSELASALRRGARA